MPAEEIAALASDFKTLNNKILNASPEMKTVSPDGGVRFLDIEYPVLVERIQKALSSKDAFNARYAISQVRYGFDKLLKEIEIRRFTRLTWKIVGPFPGDASVKELDVRHSPDDAFTSPTAKPQPQYAEGGEDYELKTVTAKVSPYKDKNGVGFVRMDGVGTYYAFLELNSEEEIECNLLMGIDDWAVVNFNGAGALESKNQCHGLIPEQHAAKIKIKKGINKVAVKLVNGGGPGGIYFDLKTDSETWPKGVTCHE
ncbi:MAG: hypothetical protein WCS96_14095 [Victivallales bacterium]